jgi:multiple antibiotic resistance protein
MHATAILDAFAGLPRTGLLAFSALFAIVNPVLNLIIFSQIAADRTHGQRLRLARRVGLYSLGLMLFALWLGSYVLNFFGITLGALKVAGGLVIAFGAWQLLHAPEQREARKEEQVRQQGRTAAAENIGDIAFFPVSIPFTIGPGTISVCITLGAGRPPLGSALSYLFTLSLAALAMAVTIWAMFSFADRIGQVVGKTGALALTRLFALILLCVAVQIIASGVETLLLPVLAAAKG